MFKKLWIKALEPMKPVGEKLLDIISPEEQPESLTQSAFTKLYERYSLAPFLPYRDFDDDGVWIDDDAERFGAYLMMYEISPIIRAGVDTADAIAQLLRSHDIPDGTIIYSFQQATNDVAPYLSAYCFSQKQSHEPMYRKLANYRTKFMLSYANGEINPLKVGGFKPRTIRYYLAVKLQTPKGKFTQQSMSQFKDMIDQANTAIETLSTTAHIGVLRLKGLEVVRKLDECLNPVVSQAEINTREYDHSALNHQLARKEVDIAALDDGSIQFHNKNTHKKCYAKVLSVIDYGRKGEPYDMANTGDATGRTYRANEYLPGNFVAFTIVEKVNQEKVSGKIKGKVLAGLEGGSWIEGKWLTYLSKDQNEIRDNVRALDEQVNTKQLGVAKVLSGIVLYHEDRKSLALATAKAENLYKESSLRLYPEKDIRMPMWFVSQTGFYHGDMDGTEKGLCRGTTCTIYNAASLFHVQGDWRGRHPLEGGLLALCRKGELALLDTFDSVENFNFIVAAPSGSGKSFLINEIAKSARSTGGKVFIIDIGLSYFQTCDLMGGKNIVFEKSATLCLNFCSEIFDEKDFLESKQMMVSLFASMCFATGKSGESFEQAYNYEIKVLSRAVDDVWHKLGCHMSVRDIYDWFVQAFDGQIEARYHQDRRIGDMIEYLREWAYGMYSKWFVGKCNLNFDNNYIVLELEELKFDQTLQTVVMNFIISRISHDVYLGWKQNKEETKRKKTTLIIDEAWDSLRSENTSAFMESASRRFRKYNAGIGIATQSFTDMERNSAGLAFAQNCNSIYALKSNVKNVEKAADAGIIPLEKHHLTWIKSITKTHDYSEFFCINRSLNTEGLYRFIVDPVTAYIYSSTGTVRDEIQAKINKGKSREEAIIEMANRAIDLDLWASSKLDKVIYTNQEDRRAFYQARLAQDQQQVQKIQGVENVIN